MVWWIIATLAAYFVKGLCGFANTLVFSSILSFTNNNINISPVEILLSYPSNLTMVLTHKSKLNKSIFIPSTIFIMMGSVVGAFLLKNVDSTAVKVFFGAVIVIVSIDMFIRETKNTKLKGSKVLLTLIGITSGVFCGLFGVGALMASYIGRVTESTEEFKANINAVFFVENTFRIILYISMGLITFDSFKSALVLLPFVFIGLFLGLKSSKYLNEKFTKKLIIVMLFISGLSLIIMNL